MTSSALGPVSLLREDEFVKVHYLDTGTVFRLEAERPIEALQTVTANDDETFVEAVEPTILAIRQVTEAGQVQTVMLSPRMALELARLLDSFLFLPTGINAN